MIISSEFVPAVGLKGPNAQTILASLIPRKHQIRASRRERLIMPDNDFVDFDWFDNTVSSPIVIILYGMTGSIDGYYVQDILKEIKANGWRAILLYYRGCSGEPNLIDRSYHLSDTLGLDTLVKELRRREPNTPITAVGYSMGANILLKWLGEVGAAADLTTAVAVSTPFDLRMASNRLRQGFSSFYQWWLIGDLHDYVRSKYQNRKPPFDFGDVTQLKSFWEFDDAITAPLNGFKDAADYYGRSSCRPSLKNITVPTLALHARDDPFMMPATIPSEAELSPTTTIELSEHGGHVGFISGNLFLGKLEFWLPIRITRHLQACLQPVVEPITITAEPAVNHA